MREFYLVRFTLKDLLVCQFWSTFMYLQHVYVIQLTLMANTGVPRIPVNTCSAIVAGLWQTHVKVFFAHCTTEPGSTSAPCHVVYHFADAAVLTGDCVARNCNRLCSLACYSCRWSANNTLRPFLVILSCTSNYMTYLNISNVYLCLYIRLHLITFSNLSRQLY